MSSLNSFATLQNVLLILVKTSLQGIIHISSIKIKHICFKILLPVPTDPPLNHLTGILLYVYVYK